MWSFLFLFFLFVCPLKRLSKEPFCMAMIKLYFRTATWRFCTFPTMLGCTIGACCMTAPLAYVALNGSFTPSAEARNFLLQEKKSRSLQDAQEAMVPFVFFIHTKTELLYLVWSCSGLCSMSIVSLSAPHWIAGKPDSTALHIFLGNFYAPCSLLHVESWCIK